MGLLSRAPTPRVSVPRGRIRSLTAAGDREEAGPKGVIARQRTQQEWQKRAWHYYDTIPEIKQASQFYARLSLLRLYAAEQDETGKWVETKNETAKEQLERIQDPGGGRSGLLATYGRLMFVCGEAQLFVSTDADTELEQWEMLSADELIKTDRGYLRRRAPSMTPEEFREPADDEWEPITDGNAVAYRLWRRHPRYSALADASMQGVLEICEELAILTRAIRARGRSRLATAGILIVNGKAVPLPPSGDTADEEASEDPFLDDLTEAMTKPIEDEGVASAVVPLVVRVDVDKLDDVMKHIQLVDPTQLYPETGLRLEAISRLAIGLDMPAEELTGGGDANHWTGWLIDEQTWKEHLQGVADQLVDDLTSAFYRPTLKAEGITDFLRFAIRYDATKIVNHPDRSKDAKDLYDRRAIGKNALRDATGFTDDDAPTEEELHEMLGVATRDASLAIYGIPSVKAGGIEPDPGVLETKDGTTVDPGTSAPEATKGTPAQPTEPPAPVRASASAQKIAAARILGASDLALHRAREIAGSRVRNKAKRDPELDRKLDGVPAGLAPHVLGMDAVRGLGLTERELVAGARDLFAESVRLFGVAGPAADALGDRIEQHAARTLYDRTPAPLPTTFANYVEGILEAR